MSEREEALLFEGDGSLTSGQFLRIVRQNAIAKDKTTDDQWIAFYAASRMDGKALTWLEDQSEEIQESWKLLRRALLMKWPAEALRRDPSPSLAVKFSSASIPTPAAAPPPARAAEPAALPHPAITSGTRTGVMRAVSLQGEDLGYLAIHLDRDGDYVMCKSKSDAQTMRFTPLPDKPYTIQVLRSGSRSLMLGFTRRLAGQVSGGQDGGILADIHQSSSEGVYGTSSTDYKGISFPITWSVLLDGSMLASWEEKKGSGIRRDLEMGVAPGSICAVTEFQDTKKASPDWPGKHAVRSIRALYLVKPVVWVRSVSSRHRPM